ncbi:MAG: 1-deoxy-D-xylulose-5-phosphate reductoisomerase [Treponema sp.]|nr:1-deoxy-D-xylulose-5-phosphate reductoisomerase [Treponema sp.]
MKKRVAVLGATGSIGKSALDVLRAGNGRLEPVLFSSHTNAEELLKLKNEFPGAILALASDSAAPAAGIDFTGSRGLLDAIAAAGADISVNGISGAAGLLPSRAVLNSGSDLALANKETVVMAGPLIFALAEEKKRNIIPVDSEHSAVFKLLAAHGKDNVREIILTASGGPFRTYTQEMLSRVTPQEALAHPTWNMGPKITVDSATMANKGLEVIEAARLFGFPAAAIKVVIHPQSIVHSMIRLKDGAVYAQMSNPDMRLPIHDALSWPETEHSPFGVLDFDSLALTFEKCDFERFPMLALAYEALDGGALLPAVYNAANEEAVEAFFKRRIGFLEIPRIVGYAIREAVKGGRHDGPLTIGNVLERDREARELTKKLIGSL